MYTKEADAHEGKPGEHEVEDRQELHMLPVPALLVMGRHVRR